MLKEYLEAGKIVGTHGVRGEARIEVWCDTPDSICKLKKMYLDEKGISELKISSARPHGNIALVKFKGFEKIEDVEKYRGKVLYINRNDIKLENGRSFIQDIIGCSVIDIDTNENYGTVTDVITGIANDIWCVENNGKEYLLPAIDSVIAEKKLEESVILIKPLKGIFDDED